MSLNLEYYSGKDEYSDGDIENKIIDFIKKYPYDYEKAFSEDSSWPVLYHLSDMRKNVISWYPFKKECTILEVGAGMGAITDELCKHAKKVTSIELSKRRATAIDLRNKNNDNLEIIVGNYKDIELSEKFDYIILNGVFEYSALYMDTDNPFIDFLNSLKKNLKEDGKILIAIENKFGLKYWCGANEDHTGIPFDGLNNYSSGSEIRTFSKNELENIANEVGMHPNFYYMFPDYKFPQVIYTDESLNNNFFSNYNNILYKKMNYIIKEKELYLDLYNNKSLAFFSNSFFVELSFEKEKNEIIFAKYNNDYRNKNTDLITFVKDNKVYKRACFKDGEKQINSILEIEDIFKKNNVSHSEVVKEKDVIYSRIEKGINLENKLIELYNLNQKDEIKKIFDSIFLLIQKCSGKVIQNDKQNILGEYDIKISDKKKNSMTFYEKCVIDIIPNNIILDGDKMCLIDQEWYLSNCPIEYAMFRSINCFISDVNDIELRDELYKEYNVDIKICQKIEERFFKTITKESYEVYLNYKSNSEYVSILHMINELNNNKTTIENYKQSSIVQKEYIDKLNSIIEDNNKNSNKQSEYIDNLNRIISESKENSKNADNYIKFLEEKSNSLENERDDMVKRIKSLENQNKNLNDSLKTTNDYLNSILNSRRWKFINSFGFVKKNEIEERFMMQKEKNKYAIEVKDMTKTFKLYSDKPNTLKEKLVRGRKNKTEVRTVLKNINLKIKKGETVALIGVNGSGKSTLLKLMTKIIYPNEGTVKTNGKLTSLLELGAGFHLDFTGRENIYFNASIFGLTRKEIDNRIQDIIDFSELGEYIDSPIRTYSSGMYMRLAFSVAINVDAEILLIDEILAVGDQHFQEKCFDKLMELSKSDKTIVIVSHTLASVKKLCNRAIWLNNGEIAMDGECSTVIKEYIKECA